MVISPRSVSPDSNEKVQKIECLDNTRNKWFMCILNATSLVVICILNATSLVFINIIRRCLIVLQNGFFHLIGRYKSALNHYFFSLKSIFECRNGFNMLKNSWKLKLYINNHLNLHI
jgi:hypothetical protein